MKARVGDRLIRDGGDGHRVCEIIGLQNADGSPPYVVRWLSDGHISLLYPGPYMRLLHPAADEPPGGCEPGKPAADGARPGSHPDGGQATGRGRAHPARPAAAGRRWVTGTFIPHPLAASWPGRGTM